MYNKKNQLLEISAFLLSLILVFLMLPAQIIEASTFSVSAPSSVNANSNFTVSFGSGTTGTYSYSVSGGSIVSSSTWVEGSGSLTVKSGGSGSVRVTVTALNVSDANYNDVTGSKSVTVSINTSSSSSSSSNSSSNNNLSNSSSQVVDDRSSDNTLKSLGIEGVELSPKFSSDVTSYTAQVWDTPSVTINASAKDSKATISGAGKKDLALGENKIEVKVTAENGSVKKYTISVTLNQHPTIFMDYNGKNLGVVKNIANINAFSGFDRCIVEYQLQNVEGWYSSELDMTIIYMIDDEDETGFYIFDKNEIISELKQIEVQSTKYFVMEISVQDQLRAGFNYEMILMDEFELMGWTFESEELSEYVLVQLMDDKGELKDYLYSVSDGTMIQYPDLAPVSVEDYVKMVDQSVSQSEAMEELELIILILACISATLVGGLGVTVFKLVRARGPEKVKREVKEKNINKVESDKITEKRNKQEDSK